MTEIEQIQSIRNQSLVQLDELRASPKPTYWLDGQHACIGSNTRSRCSGRSTGAIRNSRSANPLKSDRKEPADGHRI